MSHDLALPSGGRGWVRLHEKGGKVTELPCPHNHGRGSSQFRVRGFEGLPPLVHALSTLRQKEEVGNCPGPDLLNFRGKAVAVLSPAHSPM